MAKKYARKRKTTTRSEPIANLRVLRPSFWEGAVRLLDFGNAISNYPSSLTSPEGDYAAILGDWNAIAGTFIYGSQRRRIGS